MFFFKWMSSYFPPRRAGGGGHHSARSRDVSRLFCHVMYHVCSVTCCITCLLCHVMYHMVVLSRDVCVIGAKRRGASDHVTLHHVRWRHHDADELLQHHVVTWYGRL